MTIPKFRKNQRSKEPKEFVEQVVQINRVSKKTKGGNKLSFSVLMVIGDKKGRVGAGLGKASSVPEAMEKAVAKAKKRLIKVPMKGNTIPREITYKKGAALIFLKPAVSGTGVIAGGAVKTVLETAGIRDVISKVLGTNNKISNVYATIGALKEISYWKQVQEAREKEML